MYSLAERQQQAEVPGPCEVAVISDTSKDLFIGPARARTKVGLATLASILKRFFWIDTRRVAA